MNMKTLREALEQVKHNAVAVGHFNISEWVAPKAVFEAARDLIFVRTGKQPVSIGHALGI
jgi:fructose/tagatose bisphosphate aldolase